MKNIFLILLFFSFFSQAQQGELSIFGGPYWSNRERLSQESNVNLGFELAYEVGRSKIISNFNFGNSEYRDDSFDELFNSTTTGPNTEGRDFQFSLLYGYDYPLNERFKLNGAAGLGILVFTQEPVGALQINNPNIALGEIFVGEENGDSFGFPIQLGAEYDPPSQWAFRIKSGASIMPDFDNLIGVYFGPQIDFQFNKNN